MECMDAKWNGKRCMLHFRASNVVCRPLSHAGLSFSHCVFLSVQFRIRFFD